MNIIVLSADLLPTYFDNVQLYSLETCLRIFTKPNLPELRLLVVGLRGSDGTYDRQSNRAGDWRLKESSGGV